MPPDTTPRTIVMRGFARNDGVVAGAFWTWELRGVNGRGVDLLVRLPSGYDPLEPALCGAISIPCSLGDLHSALNMTRGDRARIELDPAALNGALGVALDLAAPIPSGPPLRAEVLLALPEVLRPVQRSWDADTHGASSETAALLAGFDTAPTELLAVRQACNLLTEKGGVGRRWAFYSRSSRAWRPLFAARRPRCHWLQQAPN